MKRGPTLLAGLLLLVFAALCVTSLVRKSGTYDEYLVGLGANLSVPESIFHPPLSARVHSLPFLWLSIPDAVWDEPHGQLRGQQIVALRSDDWMLDSARLALLPMGLGLGWVVFVFSRRLYGPWGGVFSLALFAFDPNLIAHSRLITPDVTLSCFSVLLSYRLWRLADDGASGRLGWKRSAAGLALGLMLLSKYTALLLLAILFLSDVSFRFATAGLAFRRGARAAWQRFALDWGVVLGVGGFVLWAGYGFAIGPVPGFSAVVPAPGYAAGVLFQLAQSRMPHGFYLMGHSSEQGWWYFYLVVMAIKAPLGTLLLLLVRALAGRWLGFRWRAQELYLWLPALLLVAYLSLFNTIHNGFRYLLPVYPLLLVWLGGYSALALRHRGFRLVLATTLAWVVGASLWIWPHYLSYCNELIGGPRNGYLWLSDSNLDWGQDLELLGEWMRENDVPRIELAYFGTADPAHYGIDYDYLPSANSPLRPTPPRGPGEAPPRFVALSAYQYQGVGFPRPDVYAFYQRLEPNERVGYSILIFDRENPLPR